MKEELEKLVAAGKIGRQHVEPLLELIQGGYCVHRSWGFGRITTIDTVFSRALIDFQGKEGHSMDLAFVADALKPIPPTHILARKAADLAAVRQMAAVHHLELIQIVLESFGGRANVEQIQQVLVPDVIEDDWKKWWEVARREMKKDGHFVVPLKKSEPIVYQDKTIPLQDRLLAEFRGARGLKARLTVTAEMLKSLEDLTDPAATATEAINTLNTEITSHQQTQPALALEAIFLRDDLAKAAHIEPVEGQVTDQDIWRQTQRIAAIFESMSAAKHRVTLASFRHAFPDDWHDILLGILNVVTARLCGECARLLIHEGKLPQLKNLLARLISQHTANSELLLWLGKERSDSFADVLGPEVFRSMLTAMERDQFNEKRSNRLRDFILDDHDLMLDLIESADIDIVKDLVRALQFSPSFDDMDKRSLLGRIVKIFPSIQQLISGEQAKHDSSLFVSWESLERRKNEYTELVQKKIPANSRDIAVARSYGDLRENHEYKAAKEAHRLLMLRKHELESQLARARGIDYADAKTDTVNIGTTVAVTDLESEQAERYSVLGAWDSDAERGLISYLSPVGQCLLNHAAGDTVDFEVEGHRRHYRIDSIEPYTTQPTAHNSPKPEPSDTRATTPFPGSAPKINTTDTTTETSELPTPAPERTTPATNPGESTPEQQPAEPRG
jgi:transcription elongation GreA/GreB family factor